MGQQQLAGFNTAARPEYEIVFDGGSLGNPGRGYGSYKITGPDGELALARLNFDEFGFQVTNNQAEYRSLIGALEHLLTTLGPDASGASLIVRGDSMLVIKQLLGQWKVKNVDLKPLHERAGQLLKRFGRTQLIWHDRSNSVRDLGH